MKEWDGFGCRLAFWAAWSLSNGLEYRALWTTSLLYAIGSTINFGSMDLFHGGGHCLRAQCVLVTTFEGASRTFWLAVHAVIATDVEILALKVYWWWRRNILDFFDTTSWLHIPYICTDRHKLARLLLGFHLCVALANLWTIQILAVKLWCIHAWPISSSCLLVLASATTHFFTLLPSVSSSAVG